MFVMENEFIVGVLVIFSLINCNSGQVPPNQTASDLETFVIESFSKNHNNNLLGLSNQSSGTASKNATQSDGAVLDDYEELVGSIFYKNSSLNEPDAIIVSAKDMSPIICAK